MPGLVAGKRRWAIGSDDLLFPAFAEGWVRVAWLVALCVVFSLHKEVLSTKDCTSGHVLLIYYIGMIVVLCCHTVIDVFIMALSMQGTITVPGPRRHMAKLVYIKMFMFVCELGMTIFGTYWAFAESTGCDPAVVWTVKAAALAGWIILLSLLIALLVIFDPLGSKHSTRLEARGPDEMNRARKKLWKTRCKVICCCVGDDESGNAFNDIADLLTDFFEDLDFVATDVAAGLILVRLEQEKQPTHLSWIQLTHRNQPAAPTQAVQYEDEPSYTNGRHMSGRSNNSFTVEDPSPSREQEIIQQIEEATFPHPQEWMNIYTAAHYMKFALATYGWPVYLFMNIFTGACKLWSKCSCCMCRHSTTVLDDNCCMCNTSAILRMTDVNEGDIIYASFYNRVYEIPFYVVLDHQHKAVVVAIRGTMSLRDAITDLTVEHEKIHVDGLGEVSVHRGILQAAQFIQNTLVNLQLLNTAFSGRPDYKLVITGHSLGAGAASLLAILLKPSYPNLRCFAFSPPGWLISKELARYSEDFVLSVVVGRDLVPRLGLITLEHVKLNILRTIRDSYKPKYKILAGGCWYTLCGYPDERSESENADRRRHLLDSGIPRSYSETENQANFEQSLDTAIQSSSRCRRLQVPLYMPGHVLFVDEEMPNVGCLETPTYRAAWARPEVFDEIIVHPKMLTDHLPDMVMKALDQLVERGNNPRHQVTHSNHCMT